MPFNWSDFLVLAENLHADPNVPGPREAALRSIASRAYYAAFRAALEYGKTCGFSPTHTGNDHRAIRDHIRTAKAGHPSASKLSVQLGRLHDYRRQADYDNVMKGSPESAAFNAINIAKIVFTCLADLSTPPAS